MTDTVSSTVALDDEDGVDMQEREQFARVDMLLATITARLIGFACSSGERQEVLWADAQRAIAELEREVRQ